jgi:hypothetical protein
MMATFDAATQRVGAGVAALTHAGVRFKRLAETIELSGTQVNP